MPVRAGHDRADDDGRALPAAERTGADLKLVALVLGALQLEVLELGQQRAVDARPRGLDGARLADRGGVLGRPVRLDVGNERDLEELQFNAIEALHPSVEEALSAGARVGAVLIETLAAHHADERYLGLALLPVGVRALVHLGVRLLLDGHGVLARALRMFNSNSWIGREMSGGEHTFSAGE